MVTEDELKNMSPEQIAELQQKNCIFCHIVSGKVPSKKVYEDETCIGILDINPASLGHILLIPKTHYVIMPQVPEADLGHMFKVAKNLSGKLLSLLKAKGTNIFVANGAVAGQKAPHFMIHIIPRNDDDGLDLTLPEGSSIPVQLEEVKSKLMPSLQKAFNLQPQEQQQQPEQPPPEVEPPEDKPTEQPEPQKEEPTKALEDQQEEKEEPIDYDQLKTVLDKNGM